MFCMQCGTQLPDGAAFCYACGKKTLLPQQQETKETDTSGKTFEEVFTPELLEQAAKKMAEKIAEDPVRRYQYLLRSYEEAAQQFVSDDIMQEAISLANALDKEQSTTILNDLEIKSLRPVLYLYRGAFGVWQKYYHRWEDDWKSRKRTTTQADYQMLGEKGIAEPIESVGLGKTAVSAISNHMGLLLWLEFRLLTDCMYFLRLQGYTFNEQEKLRPAYKALQKVYDEQLVELALEHAETRYKAFTAKNK